MANEPVTMTEIERSRLDWLAQHLKTYMDTGGKDGHIVDLTPIGGRWFTTCLLLKTVGRKTGMARIAPLIYGDTGGEVIIIASKGGADIHPAWYYNITASKTLDIQIATQAYRCTWREPKGADRKEIWAFMEHLYPPYKDYQAATKREIPVIAISPKEVIAPFTK